jgi:hypothetical protein
MPWEYCPWRHYRRGLSMLNFVLSHMAAPSQCVVDLRSGDSDGGSSRKHDLGGTLDSHRRWKQCTREVSLSVQVAGSGAAYVVDVVVWM